MPADAAPAPSAKAEAIEKLATGGGDVDATGWTTSEWVIYLSALPDTTPAPRLQALDDRYHLTATTNPEIAMHWLPLLVHADVRAAAPAVEAYLTKVGRVRMIRPLYAAMMQSNPFWRDLAKQTFERTKPKYHPITRDALGDLIK
jgi:hypothetical protein